MRDGVHSDGSKPPPSPAEKAAGSYIRRQIEGVFPSLKAFCKATSFNVGQLYRVTSGQQKISPELASHLRDEVGHDFEYWLKLVDNISSVSPELFENFGGVIDQSEEEPDLEHEEFELSEEKDEKESLVETDIYAPREGKGEIIARFTTASGGIIELTDRSPRIVIDSVAEAIRNASPSQG